MQITKSSTYTIVLTQDEVDYLTCALADYLQLLYRYGLVSDANLTWVRELLSRLRYEWDEAE